MYSLASGPNFTIKSYSSCVVNGVRFVTYVWDSTKKTQNYGIFVSSTENNKYYGHLEDIVELSYVNNYSMVLFKCKWFDADPVKKTMQKVQNITSIAINSQSYKDEPFILANQAKQVLYLYVF